MAKKILTMRLIARIGVAICAIAVALFFFFKVIVSPIFPCPQQQWANVAYLVFSGFAALIFYWAFTDFGVKQKDFFE